MRLGIFGRDIKWVHNRLAVFDRLFDRLVEAVEATHAEFCHQVIAPFHLGHEPVQGVGSLVHVGHHRAQQMRDVLIERKLHRLRVDQHEAQALGLVFVEQRQDHRVDAHRLARARRTAHEKVRELCQINHHRLARDVLAERKRQGRLARLEVDAADDFAQIDAQALRAAVGNLKPHVRLAGNDGNDAHGGHGKRSREILADVFDLASLDAWTGLKPVLRDDGASLCTHHGGVDAVGLELAFDEAACDAHGLFGDSRAVSGRRLQHADARKNAAVVGLGKEFRLTRGNIAV